MEEIKIEAVSATQCKVVFEVPADVVDKKLTEFFEGIKNQVEVPGFRKGKASVSLIKQHYATKDRPTIATSLFTEYYEKLLKDHNINPVSNPDIKGYNPKTNTHPGSFGFDSSYSVEFMVDVLPKITPVDYKGMVLDVPVIDETKLYNDKVNTYREQFAERRQVTDRGAVLGDSVTIDFMGYIGDTVFEGGSAQGFNIAKLGANTFITGFEDQLIGLKAGDTKKVSIKFPDNYHAAHLSGKDATFDVTLHTLVEVKPAEVNSDLALMAGFMTMEEMETKLKLEVANDRTATLRQKLDDPIVTKLLETNKFDVPKSMIEGEFNTLSKRMKVNDKTPAEFIEEIRSKAEYNVRRAMILDAIYEKESIEITPDELNIALDENARAANKTKDELISALYNSKQMDGFVGILRVAKVVDFIINNATKQERKAE